MYCTGTCPYCLMADRLLARKGISGVNRIRVDIEPERRKEMNARAGRTSVPQIFIGDVHVGGYDELSWLDQQGGLDALLERASEAEKPTRLSSEGSE